MSNINICCTDENISSYQVATLSGSDDVSILNLKSIPKFPPPPPLPPQPPGCKIICRVISHAENQALNTWLICFKLNSFKLHIFYLIYVYFCV